MPRAQEVPAHQPLRAVRPRNPLLSGFARGIAPIIGEAPHQMRKPPARADESANQTGLVRRASGRQYGLKMFNPPETCLAIDHQQFAVIAQMRGMQARGNQRRLNVAANASARYPKAR